MRLENGRGGPESCQPLAMGEIEDVTLSGRDVPLNTVLNSSGRLGSGQVMGGSIRSVPNGNDF